MKTAEAIVLSDKGNGCFFVDVGKFTTFADSNIPLQPGDKVEVQLFGKHEDEASVVRKL
jgi:protein involved in polysaccharide export with SLBB domain